MLGMKSCALLDINGDESNQYHGYHGDESCQFSYQNGKHDEADERHTNGSGSQCQESASDAHQFQWLLKSFENRITFTIDVHKIVLKRKTPYSFIESMKSSFVLLLEKQGQCFGHSNESHTAADGKHDGFLYVLVSVLHLEIDVERTDEYDDRSNGFHQVGHGCLVRRNLRSSLGESTGTFAACHGF